MNISTSHQVSRYYDFYRDTEIVFTKANLQALRIDPRQIYIKCNGGQWPCIINSTSLQSAKIIIGTTSGAFAFVAKNKNANVSLRYCFVDRNNSLIQFFVNCSVSGITKYQNSNELALINLSFTQQPPDDLIIHIGSFAEINDNFIKRREERILITKDSIRHLNLEKEESIVYINQVPRKCVVKDISFSGAKVLLVGIPKFLLNKTASLEFYFTDTDEKCMVNGNIVSADFLEGRKDIAVVNITYEADKVPIEYKSHVNAYICDFNKKFLRSKNYTNDENNSQTVISPFDKDSNAEEKTENNAQSENQKNNTENVNAKSENSNDQVQQADKVLQK